MATYTPITVVPSGGSPFVQVPEGLPAPAFTVVPNASPITLVTSNAPPIALFNPDGSRYAGGAINFGPFQTYYPGGAYSLWTGMFGVFLVPPLVNYDLNATVYPGAFPDNTTIAWNINDPPPVPSRINGFPHIAHGNYYDDPADLPGGSRQVYTITALEYTISWTFTGDVATGLLLDCWLTTSAHENGAFTDEVCAVGWLPKLSTSAISYVAGLPPVAGGTFVDAGGVSWTVKEGIAAASTGNVPNYLFYRPGNLDYEGKIDLVGAFAFLIGAGKISGNEYFNGEAIGPEPNTGSGSVIFEDFECTALASAARVPWTISNLSAVPLSGTTIRLDYRPAAGATSHQYRRDGGAWTAMPGDRIITGLSPSTSYNFEVRGVNGTGNGSASNLASATTTNGATNVLSGGTWVVGAPAQGMSNSGGFLTCLNTPNIYSDFTMAGRPFVSGKYYEVSFPMSDYVAGSVRPEFRGGTQRNGAVRAGNGVYTERLLANTGNNMFAMLLTGDPGVNTWKVANNMTVTGPYDTPTIGGL